MKTTRLLMALLMAILLPAGAWAASVTTVSYTDETTGLKYNIRCSDNVPQLAVVTDWSTPKTTVAISVPVTIPANLSFTHGTSSYTIPVVGIAEGAFQDKTNVKSVTIGSNVTSIGASAFQGCTALASITFWSKVTSIGLNAFTYCNDANGGPKVIIKKSKVTIAANLLNGQYVKELVINSGITTIGASAFGDMDHLVSVTLPTSLRTIGNYAFQSCGLLTAITIPEGVTTIKQYAFAETPLTAVDIPATVTTIGDQAFYGCSSLANVTVNWDYPLQIASDTDPFPNRASAHLHVPFGNKEYSSDAYWKTFKAVTFPGVYIDANGVRYSADEAGTGLKVVGHETWTDDKDITIMESLTAGSNTYIVTTIGDEAFKECTQLKSITIPASVTTIGNRAFNQCTSLTDLYFIGTTPPTASAAEGNDSFEGLDPSEITIHVPAAAEQAYRNHSYWSQFNIECAVVNITFADATVKAICVGTETGWDTNGDGELSEQEAAAVTDIDNYFSNDAIITFNEFRYFTSVTTIPDGAFSSCHALTEITFPASLTTIGMYAFQYCSALTDLVIPEGVTTIGWLAFQNYGGIVTLPSTLTSIESSAFQNAQGAKVSWAEPPANLTESFGRAFGFSNSGKLLYVPVGSYEIYDDTPTWWAFDIKEYGNITFADAAVKSICVSNWDDDEDGELSAEEALAVTDLGTVFQGNTTITSFNELKHFRGLTEIPTQAFFECSSLASVTLPASITTIGQEAFHHTGLTSIDVPKNVTEIGPIAFDECASLATVTLHSGLETIGSNAFGNDPVLTKIDIPATVISMNGAFTNYPTTNLGNITCVAVSRGEPIAITEGTFPNRANATLLVPAAEGVLEKYQQADYWKEFKSIVTRIEFNDAAVKAICVANFDTNGDGELTFDEAAAVTNLDNAFYGNTEISYFGELQYFTGLESIGQSAFSGCEKLGYIILPPNINSIDFSAFANTKLTSITLPEGVTAIGQNAFGFCSELRSISLPSSLETIQQGAFYNCTDLRWLTIPANVTTFGDQAFYQCTSLTNVTLKSGTPVDVNGDPFPTRADITLTVPAHATDAYQAHDYWSQFKGISEAEPNWTGTYTDENGDEYHYEEGYAAELYKYKDGSSRTSFAILPAITVDGTTYPVTSIASDAIETIYMKELTIPESVTLLKENAISCAFTPDGMSLTTIFMRSSTPPTAQAFTMWSTNMVVYNMNLRQQAYQQGTEYTPITFKDITLVVPFGAKDAYEADDVWSAFTIKECGSGNANGDTAIDINDVLAIVNYILGKDTSANFDADAADANGDGDISIADVAAIIAAILP